MVLGASNAAIQKESKKAKFLKRMAGPSQRYRYLAVENVTTPPGGMMVLGTLKAIGSVNSLPVESKTSTRTDCGNADVFAIVILLAQPPPVAHCGNSITPTPGKGLKAVVAVVGTTGPGKTLFPLNCVGVGSAVKNGPVNARPKMAMGTFELM